MNQQIETRLLDDILILIDQSLYVSFTLKPLTWLAVADSSDNLKMSQQENKDISCNLTAQDWLKMVKHNSRTRFRFSTQLINLIKFKLVLLHGKVSKNQEPALKACVEPGQTIQKSTDNRARKLVEKRGHTQIESLLAHHHHILSILVLFLSNPPIVSSFLLQPFLILFWDRPYNLYVSCKKKKF